MSNKILFLDIDGPMIPGRAYVYPDRIDGLYYCKFDPVAVAMVNNICGQRDYKIVLHTSWIRPQIFGPERTYQHCTEQGLDPYHFHKDAWCDPDEPWRYTRIHKWLEEHPEVDTFAILDDTNYEENYSEEKRAQEEYLAKHVCLVSLHDGMLMKHYNKLMDGNWTR